MSSRASIKRAALFQTKRRKKGIETEKTLKLITGYRKGVIGMRKLIGSILIAGLSVSAATFASACGAAQVYTGEYHYHSYGTEYGVKVEVKVTGDRIKSVTILDSDYTKVSDPVSAWTEERKKNYEDNEASFLRSFEGKTVAEVRAYQVRTTNSTPDPNGITAEGLDLITGATQSCGRLILAVHNALENA